MADKLVITAALCGGATRKEQNPNVPYTPKEFAREASWAEEAGAAIVHIHFRDPDTGLPSADPTLIDDVVQAIRENSNALLNISTGFQGPFLPQESRKVGIERHSPDMASLNPGTMNFCIVNHKTQQLGYPAGCLFTPRHSVNLERCGHDTTNGHARVERGVGILEDHLHPLSHSPQVLAFETGQIHSVKRNLAAGSRVELQDGPAGCGLAAPAFPHQAQRLTTIDIKTHPIHRFHIASTPPEETTGDGKVLADITEPDQRLSDGHQPSYLP